MVVRKVIGDRLFDVPTGESTNVPVRARHRIENPSATPLVIVEVQCGDYVGEDAIGLQTISIGWVNGPSPLKREGSVSLRASACGVDFLISQEHQMTHFLEELAKRAQDLSLEERAQLAQDILESNDHDSPPEVRDAWHREIARRVDSFERGEAKLVSAADVFEEARRLTP